MKTAEQWLQAWNQQNVQMIAAIQHDAIGHAAELVSGMFLDNPNPSPVWEEAREECEEALAPLLVELFTQSAKPCAEPKSFPRCHNCGNEIKGIYAWIDGLTCLCSKCLESYQKIQLKASP